MFDPDTRNVTYDPNRGEPRGGRRKEVAPSEVGLGDCIDCGQCVQVCPTGIDIRDGLQYECIGCALCIDACDDVMDKMDYPRGLIRYTTENELDGKPSKLLRPRTFGYGLMLALMIGVIGYTVATRVPAQLDVLRDRGALFKFNGEGRIENSYTLKLANMSEATQTYTLSVSGMNDLRILTLTQFTVTSGEKYALPTVVDVPPEAITQSNNDIVFKAVSGDEIALTLETESRFVGPTR
jgi:cytochrome c oxidase accessory protein FixG